MKDDPQKLLADLQEASERMGWKYILDDEHNVLAVKDILVWAGWFEQASRDRSRVVAQDQVGDSVVSTVFLALDHNWSLHGPPIVFETMVFGGSENGRCWRYATWKDAEIGHARAVRAVKYVQKKFGMTK